MAKYLLLKHYRGAPAAVNDVPMDRATRVTTSNTSSLTSTTAPATRFRLDALAILVKGKDRYFEPAVEYAAVQ